MKNPIFTGLVVAASLGLSASGITQQTLSAGSFTVALETNTLVLPLAKPVTLDFLITDSESKKSSKGLSVKASVSMAAMAGMGLDPARVTEGEMAGHYLARVTFPQSGKYRILLSVGSPQTKPKLFSFKIILGNAKSVPVGGMQGMNGDHGMGTMARPMRASYGLWPVTREGSGTSWQSDSAPMFMAMLPPVGGFEVGVMGTVEAGYVDAGGKRGGKELFSNSMMMLMGREDLGGGSLGLHFMSSLDPIINGRRGVPNLFQNGFTVHGVDINDRKDPHNVIAELAASYSHPISKDLQGFVYGGPAGDPTLGNNMYLHRASGSEIPEAPITHDWFDGTHISFGVATVGLVYQEKWKLEGSVFNGHDPVNLYSIGTVALNSASGRLSFNPSRDWSFSTSYGYLNSDVNTHRFTVSASYSHYLSDGDNFSATTYLGQNIVQGMTTSNACLLEATLYHAQEAFFMRFEHVDKSELLNVPVGNYTVSKLLIGDTHNFLSRDQIDYGIGAYIGVYSFPGSLNSLYGKNPITVGVFLRIRPGKS